MSFEKIIFLLFSLFIFSIIIYYLFFDNNNKSNKNPENLNIKRENPENLNIKKENPEKENLNKNSENPEKIKIDSESNISILIHYDDDEKKKGVLESTNFDYNSENIALVNAANQKGIGGGGVDAAFNMKGSPVQLQEYRKKIMKTIPNNEIQIGETVLLESNAECNFENTFGSKYIFLTVGPNFHNYKDKPDEAYELLKNAYINTIKKAIETDNIKLLKFSLLSSSIFAAGKSDEILQKSLEYILKFIDNEKLKKGKLEVIMLCCFNDSEFQTLSDHSKKNFNVI